jgi:hypothetical protein
VKDSRFISPSVARLVAAPVVALAAATFTFFLLFFLLMPLHQFDSEPVVFYGVRLVASFFEGFAFVFAGSLVAGRRWPVISALGLVCLGILCFVYLHTRYSSDGFPAWHLAASIAGGLVAVGIQTTRRHERAC